MARSSISSSPTQTRRSESSQVSTSDQAAGPAGESGQQRAGYHHGALRAALVAAGLDLARQGGADAIVVREVVRRVGVSPRAAYRHFADRYELVEAVGGAALGQMAQTINHRVSAISETDPEARARATVTAIGLGYLDFAFAEPGWFDAAFFGLIDMAKSVTPDAAGAAERPAFVMLTDALDTLVAAGGMPAAKRPGADVACWSAVHGFAVLATRGPLRETDLTTREMLGQIVVARAIEGVTASD